MIKFFKQNNKKRACPKCLKHSFCRRGFTLVEVLVALFIFTLSVTAMMAVFASGISSISATKKKMAAEYLAQEGIEVVRNIRDTYALQDLGVEWDNFKNHFSSCSTSCYFGTISNPTTGIVFNNVNIDLENGFNRSIKVEPITGTLDEVKVSSKVTWQQGTLTKTVTFSENLYNWIE